MWVSLIQSVEGIKNKNKFLFKTNSETLLEFPGLWPAEGTLITESSILI